MAYCKVCKTELRPHIQDLKLHKSRVKHQNNVLLLSKPAAERMDSFVTARPRDTDPVIMYAKEIKAAELRLAAHVAVHGSFFAADHLAPLVRDCFKDSAIASSVTLGGTKCTALVTRVLGPVLKEFLLADLKDSQFSLILDESTDVANTKEMAVVVRYFSQKSGMFCTAFLGLIPISDASSSGLFLHLKAFLDDVGLDLANCVGVGTDGASVMCGKHNSLFTRMKEVNPRLVLVKCLCHSLHLVCNEAVDVLPTHMDYLVRETFNWFAHSPKRQQMYKAIYAAINSGQSPKKLVGLSATRWLSIAGALQLIVDQWLELKTHFEVAKSQERCYSA